MLVLLSIWSAAVWVLHSLLVWSVAGAGVPPDWMPGLQAAAASLLPWLESTLSMLPSAAAWLSPLAWLVWAIGLLLLGVAAAIGQALIWTTRRAARA